MKTYHQWELKNDSIVELPDGTRATFVAMDGMYAKWIQNGEHKIGNFEKFEKTDFGYKVKTKNEKKHTNKSN